MLHLEKGTLRGEGERCLRVSGRLGELYPEAVSSPSLRGLEQKLKNCLRVTQRRGFQSRGVHLDGLWAPPGWEPRIPTHDMEPHAPPAWEAQVEKRDEHRAPKPVFLADVTLAAHWHLCFPLYQWE